MSPTGPSPDFGTSERVVGLRLLLCLCIGAIVIGVLGYLGYHLVFVALIAAFTICVSLGQNALKLSLVISTAINSGRIKTSDEEISQLKDDELPLVTILAPHYKESVALAGQVECFSALDWPSDKLEVLLLIRQNDVETIKAVEKINLPSNFRIVWVGPKDYSGKKPGAVNVGLSEANGEIITIMDSESRPERDQLKKVWLAFQKNAGTNIAAVQARTLVYNGGENFLTRHYAAEYTFHHKFIVPALAKLRLYLPLPGNSIYFQGDVFKGLALDAYSLTEDAELGVRFYMAGYRTVSIDSTTWEEAPTKQSDWIRQRSRWDQGFGQTELKFMRRPFLALRLMGVRSFCVFHLMLGATVAIPTVNPIFWAMTIAYIVTGSSFLESLYPPVLFYLGLVSMVTGNFIMLLLAQIGCLESKDDGHVKWMFTIPYYWLLQTIAAWRATYRLLRNITGWEVTPKNIRTETSPTPQLLAEGTVAPTQPQGGLSQSQP